MPTRTSRFCWKPPRAASPKTTAEADRGACERRAGDAPRSGQGHRRHERHSAQSGPARDAEDPGLRQRIAGHGLDERSGQGERRAREERREDPRHPGVQDERDGPAGRALDPVRDVAQQQLAVAQQNRGDRHADHHRHQRGCGGEEDRPAPEAQPIGGDGPGGVPDPRCHHDQEHGADEAGDDAGRHGDRRVRRHHGAQQHVRAEDQRRTQQTGERNAHARPGERAEPAGERADEGGCAQADEADRSGERDGRCGEQHGEHDHGDAGGANRDADPAGRVVAESQRVDPAGDQQQPDESDESDRRHLQHTAEPALGDAALVPLIEAVRLLRKQQEQPLGDRGQAEGESTARENQPDGARAQTGQSEHDGRRHETAGERDGGGGEQRERGAGEGGQPERQVGAGVHREGVGCREHVAADRLQGGAGHPERGPDEQPRGQSRQPRGDDDGCVGRIGLTGERLPDLGRADRGRALCEVGDREGRDQQDQCGQDCGRARPGGAGPVRGRRCMCGGSGGGDGHGVTSSAR